MSLRRNRFTVVVSEAEVVGFRPERPGLAPAVVARVPVGAGPGDAGQGVTDADLRAAIGAVLDAIVGTVRSAHVEVVVSWGVAPGCVVDLGTVVLPARVRDELARRRLAELFALESPAWKVRLQDDEVCGPVVAFAMRAALGEAIAADAKRSGARIACVQPALVWAINRHGGRFESGWWLIEDGHRLLVASMHRGRCQSVDAVPGIDACNEAGFLAEDVVQRVAWSRGRDATGERIGRFRLSQPFEFVTPPATGVLAAA